MKQLTHTISAPTRAQAEAAATPVRDAFTASGWEIAETLWVSPETAAPLALRGDARLIRGGDGALRLVFVHAHNDASVPAQGRRQPVAARS
jgi:hypothetical protein